MLVMVYGSTRHLYVALIALGVNLAALCVAQPGLRLDSPSTRELVIIVHVKPEMLNRWLDLQKNEVVPALKKSGLKTRTVYSSGLFGNAFEYTIILPLTNFADFDFPGKQAEALGSTADARLTGKVRACIASSTSFLSTVLPDLSNPGESRHAGIVQFLRLRVATGRMQEYETLFKTEALPALKAANSRVIVARRGLGTNGYDLTFETPMTKFADLDAPPPLLRALGKAGAAKLVAQFNSIATVMENTVLVREADLSF
jgi:hypothetical protein